MPSADRYNTKFNFYGVPFVCLVSLKMISNCMVWLQSIKWNNHTHFQWSRLPLNNWWKNWINPEQ